MVKCVKADKKSFGIILNLTNKQPLRRGGRKEIALCTLCLCGEKKPQRHKAHKEKASALATKNGF